MDEINWEDRLIGIKGSRGVGKTTFLLDYAREYFGADNKECLYINLNHFYFTERTLVDFAAEFRAKGGKVLLIDQVFKYRQGELLKEGVAIVDGGYENQVKYEYVSFKQMKPKMMEEAIANAEKTAAQFAKNSKSKLNKIVSADQGQFSIEDRDQSTPYVKKVRVVTTIVYSLKD